MEITYKKHGATMYFAGSDGIDDTKGIIDEDKPIKLVIGCSRGAAPFYAPTARCRCS